MFCSCSLIFLIIFSSFTIVLLQLVLSHNLEFRGITILLLYILGLFKRDEAKSTRKSHSPQQRHSRRLHITRVYPLHISSFYLSSFMHIYKLVCLCIYGCLCIKLETWVQFMCLFFVCSQKWVKWCLLHVTLDFIIRILLPNNVHYGNIRSQWTWTPPKDAWLLLPRVVVFIYLTIAFFKKLVPNIF